MVNGPELSFWLERPNIAAREIAAMPRCGICR
jgi:hypothetical protein